jgi:hypothetical protein
MSFRKGVVGVGALVSALGLFQACATEAVTVDDDGGTPQPQDASTDRTVTPIKDAGRDTSTPPADAGRDSSPVDSGRDSAVADGGDSGVLDRDGDPFDPLAPKAGDACPVGTAVNDVVERRCGKCGVQRAVCEAGRVVGVYGPCTNEKTAATACLPGERRTVACGFCGRQVRNCDTACSYNDGACQGEVVGGCVAGSVKYLSTCANPAEARRQVCSATCSPGTPEACAPRAADGTLAVSQTVGGKVSQTFTPDAALKIPALSSPFCATTLSTTINSIYSYVLLQNTGAQAANVTVTNTSLTTDAAFAAYPGTTLPGDRLACQDHVGINKFTVTIPAGGSQLVYVGGLSATAAGPFPLEVVTNFLGAEVAPAPDHLVAISQTMGGTVAQALTFVEDKFLPITASLNAPTDYTGAHPCPVVKMGVELPYRYVRLNNSGATARTVNLITTSVDDDSYMAVYASVPTSGTRRACVGAYNDDCTATDPNACLNGVTVPANGSVVVYVGQDTFDGLYDTNSLRVTTTN